MATEIWAPTSSYNTPMLWINRYLSAKIPELTGLEQFPFFPSTPSTINDLTEYFANSTQGIAATWDRLIRMRRSPFPHIKQEQALYYFYAQGSAPTETMVRIQEAVLRLMDREDETAQEINDWSKGKVFDGMECQFYFHRFRIYQLEEVRDIIDFGTARTYGGNKIIIDFEYHQMPAIINS
ncbi:hypothetical protein EB001_17950 [bacterium]|nr:hypothetical protein [bacterium]